MTVKKPITFFDTTLRDGMQTRGIGCDVSKRIAIAESIARCNPEYIEISMPANKEDFEMMPRIAKCIYDVNPQVGIAALCRNKQYDIDLCAQAFDNCPQDNKLAHIFIPTSKALRKHSVGKSKQVILEDIAKILPYAKEKLGAVIESTPEDSTATENSFLEDVVQTKISCGAKRINFPDTTGWGDLDSYREMYRKFTKIYPNITFHTHPHDDDGCAVAKAIFAVKGGATCVEGTVLGIGERAGNVDWMVVAAHLLHKGYDVSASHKEFYHAAKEIAKVIGYEIPPNYPIFGKNSHSTSSGIHGKAVNNDVQSYHHFDPAIIGAPPVELVLGQTSGAHIVASQLDFWKIPYCADKLHDITEVIKKRAMSIGEVGKDETLVLLQNNGYFQHT